MSEIFTAKVIIVHPKSVILGLRPAKSVNNRPGQYVLIGGKVEDGESPLEAAVRETQEEIGYDMSPESLIPVVSNPIAYEGIDQVDKFYKQYTFVHHLLVRPNSKINKFSVNLSEEHTGLHWFRFEHTMREGLFHPAQRAAIADAKRLGLLAVNKTKIQG